jgi:hypothetical protein
VRRLEAWTLQYVLVQPLLACLHLATHHYHASPSSSSSYEASGHYSDSHTHAHSSSSSDSSSSTWVGSLSAGMVQWVLSTDGEVWVSRFSAVASLVSTTLSLSALAGFYHTFQQVNQRRVLAVSFRFDVQLSKAHIFQYFSRFFVLSLAFDCILVPFKVKD